MGRSDESLPPLSHRGETILAIVTGPVHSFAGRIVSHSWAIAIAHAIVIALQWRAVGRERPCSRWVIAG